MNSTRVVLRVEYNVLANTFAKNDLENLVPNPSNNVTLQFHISEEWYRRPIVVGFISQLGREYEPVSASQTAYPSIIRVKVPSSVISHRKFGVYLVMKTDEGETIRTNTVFLEQKGG